MKTGFFFKRRTGQYEKIIKSAMEWGEENKEN